MTEVESELDALSERYNLLRDRLDERKSEIENTLKRVADFLKQMQGIMVQLDDKVRSRFEYYFLSTQHEILTYLMLKNVNLILLEVSDDNLECHYFQDYFDNAWFQV